ncbi:MAG: hypothetical protein ABMB14_02100 [Myxococcota bacterium]
MRTMLGLLLALAATGCAQDALLPLVDADGALAGTYDPATGKLSIPSDADAVRAQGEEVELVDGAGVVDWVLAPGDELEVVSPDGTSETVEIGDPALIDGMDDEDAGSRYGSCLPRNFA